MLYFYFSLYMIASAMNTQEQPAKIVFFGDSITEAAVKTNGFINLIDKRLIAENKNNKYNLIGAGISGNKIYDLYFRMEKDVLATKPDIVVIWIGVNDVWHKSMKGTGSDLNKFEVMYETMIEKFQSAGIKVYCCTPACIGEKTDHSNSQDGDLNEFSKSIRKIAANKSAGLIDFRSQFLSSNLKINLDNKYQGILTTDGVHLNDKGNQLVADILWQTLIK